jgi:hypothetical protein
MLDSELDAALNIPKHGEILTSEYMQEDVLKLWVSMKKNW